jgi:hypothetical protein
MTKTVILAALLGSTLLGSGTAHAGDGPAPTPTPAHAPKLTEGEPQGDIKARIEHSEGQQEMVSSPGHEAGDQITERLNQQSLRENGARQSR